MNRLRLPRFCLKRGLAAPCAGALLLACLAALPGCLLFDWSTGWAGDSANGFKNASLSRLAKMPAPKAAVTLEVVFVERPANDPLLGSALWDEVDQIGPLGRRTIGRLWRIWVFAWAGWEPIPPRALQTLMGLSPEVGNEHEKRLAGGRWSCLPGPRWKSTPACRGRKPPSISRRRKARSERPTKWSAACSASRPSNCRKDGRRSSSFRKSIMAHGEPAGRGGRRLSE